MRKVEAKAQKAQKKRKSYLSKRVDGVVFENEIDGVKVINMCTWLDHEFPEWMNDFSLDAYDRHCERVKSWCKENKAHYYGRPSESFFIHEAVEETKEKEMSIVLVEDLS